MKWSLIRNDEQVLLMFIVSRSEADEVCNDLNTFDESTPASKMAFSAFMAASDHRERFESGETA